MCMFMYVPSLDLFLLNFFRPNVANSMYIKCRKKNGMLLSICKTPFNITSFCLKIIHSQSESNGFGVYGRKRRSVMKKQNYQHQITFNRERERKTERESLKKLGMSEWVYVSHSKSDARNKEGITNVPKRNMTRQHNEVVNHCI